MKRYARNAPGDFYVVDGDCMTCMLPKEFAPTLMELEERPGGMSHCYFKRQPETPDETFAAVEAIAGSCCQGLRYAGRDPAILAQLRTMGLSDCCDALASTRSEPVKTTSLFDRLSGLVSGSVSGLLIASVFFILLLLRGDDPSLTLWIAVSGSIGAAVGFVIPGFTGSLASFLTRLLP